MASLKLQDRCSVGMLSASCKVAVMITSVISTQAAYLVGVSDPNSQAGHQGLVDPIQFAKANQAIQMACQNLVDPDSSPSQVYFLSINQHYSELRGFSIHLICTLLRFSADVWFYAHRLSHIDHK